jgi:hypothetical protein
LCTKRSIQSPRVMDGAGEMIQTIEIATASFQVV